MISPRAPRRAPRPLAAAARIALVLTLGACAGSGAGRGPEGTLFGAGFERVRPSEEAARLERRLFELVGRDRAAAGLPAFAWDDELAAVARAHAADMVAHRFFEHDSPTTGTLEDRLDRAGYASLESRENLASAGDAEQAEKQLMASPGHRTNLLSKSVTHLGIGVVRGDPHGADGRLLAFVQVFARPAPHLTADDAAARVLAALGASRGSAAPLERLGLLDELARREIVRVRSSVPQEDLRRAGDAVVADLAAHKELGLRGLSLDAQAVLGLEQYEPPALFAAPGARAFGLAVAPDVDPRGRPVVKIFLLVGR
ncbi:MAG: CAP domain-containing protein [Myxococcales bacterium]|nr:CAP domain-containing protein [Myxococcales bacterium]